MDNCRVYPEGFETIARAMESRQISVVESPVAPDSHDILTSGTAVYNPNHDGFYFPLSPEFLRDHTPNPSQHSLDHISRVYGEGYFESHTQLTRQRKAVIIHEAVHALQDYNHLSTVNYVVEGAGYLAQEMYVQLTGGQVPSETGIHRTAGVIAARLLRSGYEVTAEEIEQLRTSLATYSEYRGDNDLQTIYNGI